MASMSTPICLVENKNECLSVNQEAIKILEEISQPVVVVAIVGMYRTGKSYLMNRLAGQNHGFPLGSTVQPETKGIWMWCVPHPSKSDHTLVLLDTEGLGDVEKGDPKNDSWIFALAVLLCSCFVYNSVGTINHQALEQLHYVKELTELIRAKSSPSSDDEVEDSTEFVSFFPDFIWTVRDFTLELKLNGCIVTEDQYLENALKLIPGKICKIQMSNLPRECIRNFFPKRKCFIFDRPTVDKKLLANMEKVSEDQLDPIFLDQTNKFCSYVFKNARTKTLGESKQVTGNGLSTLVVTYVGAINNGSVPCLENAVTTLAQTENSAAVLKAADYYTEQMSKGLDFPTFTLQEFLDVHAACEKEAIEVFMEHSFKDINQEFQKNLVLIIKNKKEDFSRQNEEASVQYCQAQLDQISKTLIESISLGVFLIPDGHKLYMEEIEKVKQKYEQVPKKGVKATEVLQKFLESQIAIEKSILQSDKALTEKEKAIAEEKAKKEAIEKEQELLKQKMQQHEQETEAQKRTLQENIAQLEEKMKQEKEDRQRSYEAMLEHKLKLQQEFLNEGFEKKHEDLKAEIVRLKNKVHAAEKDDSFQSVLEDFAHGVFSVVSTPETVKSSEDTMASMSTPICLVENKNECLSVNQEAIKILEEISQPVVVVAIVGMYRTGKSYLMNRLAGQNHGFPLGSTVQSETKGIWMWCVPHPSKPDHTLVLLDTEGLGDVEKGDTKNDSWIFALAVLLCSCFVYNSMGTINHQALEQLHYVTELTELIRAKSSPSSDDEVEDSTEFVSFFPDFLWTVRDFALELMLNGCIVTEDQYLENALKLIPGKTCKIQMSNLPRECIRNFFPKRKCFIFDRPTDDKKLLANMEKVSEDQLDPIFLDQTNKFCSYVFKNARTKTLRESIKVTGNGLSTLVVTYVGAINNGSVPCLENAVTTLAQTENSAAVLKAADYYTEQMSKGLDFPTFTLQEFLDVHAACEKEAIEVFMEHSFKDINQEFQKNLVLIIKNKKEDFSRQNEEASVQYCQAQLDQFSQTLMESISSGTFSVPGGHKLYREEKEKVKQKYEQVPRKGVKATEILQKFLASQVAIEKAILQSDQALTDQEKAIAEGKAKKEALEKEQELMKQKMQEQEQEMEAQQRCLQENRAQLEEKMKQEREDLQRSYETMLEHKLKVQQEFLDEGFKGKSEELNAEIAALKKKMNTAEDDNPFLLILDDFIHGLGLVLSSPFRVVNTIVGSLTKK